MSNRDDLCRIRAQLHQLDADLHAVEKRGSPSAAFALDRARCLLVGATAIITSVLRNRVDIAAEGAVR